MTSDSIASGRVQGAVAVALVATLAYAAVSAVISVGPAPAFTCSAPNCVIPVDVNTYAGGLNWRCNLKLSSEVTVPKTATTIEWKINTPGYSFVPGGYAVSPLNDAGDFAAGAGSTGRAFKLLRTASPVSQRVYRYNLAVESTSGEFCMVPTLPRIKNE